MKTIEFLMLVWCVILIGCASGKLSGTDVVTPYGAANSINIEGNIGD